MEQFFKKSRFGSKIGLLNEDLMIQNTDRFEPSSGPYLTPHQRKRYVKKGIVHYHLNRIREDQGVPNPFLKNWEYQKEDSITKKKSKDKKKQKGKQKKKNGEDAEDPDDPKNCRPYHDSSEDDDPTESEDDDEKEDEKEELDDDTAEKRQRKAEAFQNNPLQVQAQEKDPQDILPDMPMQDYVGKHPFRMILSGKTGSGKSTLLTWLINNFYADYFTDIIVFAKTAKTDPVWRYARVDPDLMFNTFDEAKITAIRKEQDAYINTHGIASSRRILIIVDDFASDPHAMHARVLNELFFHGRKDNISVCILTQQYYAVRKRNRENAEIVIVFPTGNNAEQEALQSEQRSIYFHSGVEGNYCFDEIYRHCVTPDPEDVDDYPFMVINTQSKDPKKIYRKRLHGVIELKINPLTKMVDADFTLKGRRERAQWAKTASSGNGGKEIESQPMSLQDQSAKG